VSEFPPGTRHWRTTFHFATASSAGSRWPSSSWRRGAERFAHHRECALEQGREVMAVPGSVLNLRHGGSHGLLRDGARLVESAEDVLDEVGVMPMRG